MITVSTPEGFTTLEPTIFPDGTSQIWKIAPLSILYSKNILITWHFESEREILDLYSFKALLHQQGQEITLHIPYLPYARQDKHVSNNYTFNLVVFAQLINGLEFNKITSVDVHNPLRTMNLIRNFENIEPTDIHKKVLEDFDPSFVVFPDKGAMDRYNSGLSGITTNFIYFEKTRDQSTGAIIGLEFKTDKGSLLHDEKYKFLIVDDICDGGATFIAVAKKLKEINKYAEVALFVTHGIFSKGRQHLLDNGIDKIYTTNSMINNKDGFPV